MKRRRVASDPRDCYNLGPPATKAIGTAASGAAVKAPKGPHGGAKRLDGGEHAAHDG